MLPWLRPSLLEGRGSLVATLTHPPKLWNSESYRCPNATVCRSTLSCKAFCSHESEVLRTKSIRSRSATPLDRAATLPRGQSGMFFLRAASLFLLAVFCFGQSPRTEPGAFRAQAAAARNAGNLPGAIDLYRQALAATPQWLEGWWFLGNLQYATDRYGDARDSLTHYVALSPNAPAALALRGLCSFETGAYDDSLQDIQRALALGAANQPRNGQILLYHEALLLTRLGQFDQATAKYILFVKKGLINPDVEAGLGLAGLRMPLLPKEIAAPDAPLVTRTGQAAIKLLTSDAPTGRQAFAELLTAYPGRPNLHYFCGYLLFTTDPGPAIEEFQAELAVAPGSALAHGMLAWAYEFRDEYALALPHAQAAVAADPSSTIAQLVLGRALLESGKETANLDTALAHLDQVVRADPANLEAHLTLAKVYSRLGRKDDAHRERLLALLNSPARESLPMRILSLTLLLLTSVAFAQARPKASPCAGCHSAQTLWQPDTQMGRALQLRGSNPTLDALPKLTFHAGKYTYTVETRNGLTQYIVADGEQSISLPVLWTMGAEAQTWIVQRNGRMIESLVSFYPILKGLDITTGDEQLRPATLEEALGRSIGDEDAKACFGCHATDAVVDHKLNLAGLKPGLTCAHCHTGTMEHLAKIVHNDDSSLPPDLGSLSSEDMSNFCGQCHRTWETVVRSHWIGSSNVRFQPYRLANSRCFDGNDPRIGCIACHNPHEKVTRDAAYYDGKCLACHAPALVVSDTNTIHAKACPVAKSACSSCHMPKVPLPNGHLTFTDHQIRVVKAGEKYPN